jgi:hypothetical protein
MLKNPLGTQLYEKRTMKWADSIIKTSKGEQQAISPLVISASRRTDIPAFHTKWFVNRLREGYCIWENPFNTKQQQYISFEKTLVSQVLI